MKGVKLDPKIRDLLKDDRIKYRTAMFLQSQDARDRPMFFRLFEEIKFGINKQREITEWLEDVVRRDGRLMGEVLDTIGLREVLEDPLLNGPQKGDRFRDRLFALRFPSVSRYLEGLRARLQILALPDRVKLIPLTPLEDGEFRMEITFHSARELGERLDDLKAFMKTEAFKTWDEFLKTSLE
jgi:hypothetical protein